MIRTKIETQTDARIIARLGAKLNVPTNLTLSLISGGVNLAWEDQSSGRAYTEIWGKSDAGNYQLLSIVAKGISTKIDMIDPVAVRTYKIRSWLGSIYSPFTADVSIEMLGAEMIRNGSFANTSEWTLGTGWSISGGMANCDGSQTGSSDIYQENYMSVGLTYQFTYTLDLIAGSIQSWSGDMFAKRAKSGTHTIMFKVTSASLITITADADFIGTISNVSLKRILNPSVLYDNSFRFYDYEDTNSIIKDETDKVSAWGDKNGQINAIILQADTAKQPTLEADGLGFDGIDDFMQSNAFALSQPTSLFVVFKQRSWDLDSCILDGNTIGSGSLVQNATSPGTRAYAGAFSLEPNSLELDEWGIVKIVFNGASSKLQIDRMIPYTGDFGAGNMGGITIGAYGNGTFSSDIVVKAIITRPAVLLSSEEESIYAYLQNRYLPDVVEDYGLGDSIGFGATYGTQSFFKVATKAKGTVLRNYSVGGYWLTHIVTRYAENKDYMNRKGRIFIQVGTNDILHGTGIDATWNAEYRALIEQMIADKFIPANIYVTTPPYYSTRTAQNEVIRGYLNQMAIDYGIRSVDMITPTLAGGGDTLLTDTVHPNAEGVVIMGNTLLSAVT